MVYRLRNERELDSTLSITGETWFSILDLAETYGWNPIGTVVPGQWDDLEMALAGYFLDKPLGLRHKGNGEHSRLVMIEDALNLADALEQAFREYEHIRVPASFFLFEPVDQNNSMPSIGALTAVIDICRTGAFWVERCDRLHIR